MIKYILHGGNTRLKSKDNDNFFREILNNLASHVNLLIIYFAREESEWPELLKQDKENFTANNKSKTINFTLASKDKHTLINQIKKADAIYMRGGDPEMLKTPLTKIPNLQELFTGKTVAGSSSGAYVLSKFYMTSKNVLGEGLGILPIKTFAHYNKSRNNELNRLKNYGENFTVHALAEGKFVVIKV